MGNAVRWQAALVKDQSRKEEGRSRSKLDDWWPQVGTVSGEAAFQAEGRRGQDNKLYVAAAGGEMNNLFEEGKEGRAARTTNWRNYLTNWRDGSAD